MRRVAFMPIVRVISEIGVKMLGLIVVVIAALLVVREVYLAVVTTINW